MTFLLGGNYACKYAPRTSAITTSLCSQASITRVVRMDSREAVGLSCKFIKGYGGYH